MAEEQVIDDYYVSLQKGEIDSRARIGDLSKEELLEKLKENLNSDLDKIAAQINSSGKDKWRNSTKSTVQQNKHIRFSSDEEGDENKEKSVTNDNEKEQDAAEEQLEKKPTPRKAANYKSPSPTKRVQNGGKKMNGGNNNNTNRKHSPSKPKKVIDYNQFEALNGAPRVNEKIAFQILEISSNFTPEVSDYKVGTVVDFDSKTNETTLQLHSEYNSILKRPTKFSVVFEETEDDEQLNYEEESPRSNKSNKEEEIIKVDWRNLMNIKLIPESFDLKQLQDDDEEEKEGQEKENGHKSEDESEEQVIDDYYETVKKVDRYNKSKLGKQQQHKKQEKPAETTQKGIKKQQEEKVKPPSSNVDLNRIASSVNAHAKAKWKNSAPSKTTDSNASKHIRFSSGSSSSSSSSSSTSSDSSSSSSSSNDDEEMRSIDESTNKTKKITKTNQDRKEKIVDKKQEQVNKAKQQHPTQSQEIKKTQVTKSKSPKDSSKSQLKSFDLKSKTKEEEKEKPTVAIDTQTFMIQIGNVFELNSNSNEVTVKFNSNCKSEINLKITNKDKSEETEKKKKKKEEKSVPKVELDWKNSMNVKLIPNEISLNMKSQKEEDEDVKMKESSSSESESGVHNEMLAYKSWATLRPPKQDSSSKRKMDESTRQQKHVGAQKASNQEKANSKTSKIHSSSASTHIRFPSSSSSDSSSSSSTSSSCSSTSSSSESSSSDSEDERIQRKAQQLKAQNKKPAQQQNRNSPKNNQQEAKVSPKKQATNQDNTQQQHQEQQRNKYYQPSKEEQVNAVSYNRAFLLQNPKDLSDFKKVFNQTKLNAPNPEEFLLKYDQDDQHPPELIIDEEAVLAQQQQDRQQDELETVSSSAAAAVAQYQEPSYQSLQDQAQQQLEFLQEQDQNVMEPSKVDYTKFEPLNGIPNAEDKIAFQLLEISPNYTPEVSNYKVATVLGFDHDSGEITLKLDSNEHNSLLDKPSTSLVEGLDLLANGEFRPQELKEDVLKMDWRNLMNIRLLPKAHL